MKWAVRRIGSGEYTYGLTVAGFFLGCVLAPHVFGRLASNHPTVAPATSSLSGPGGVKKDSPDTATDMRTLGSISRTQKGLYPQLAEQELLDVQRLEDDCIPAVCEMEKNGAPLDLELLERFAAECEAEHQRLLREVSAECGFAFEHKPAGWARLFEKLGLKPTESYDEAALTGANHPLVAKGYLAAQFASLNSKTFKAYRENVRDGVLYFNINQLRGDDGGTVSGRFSIGYVQQVPNSDNHTKTFGDRLFPRQLFIPGTPGAQYLEADAAQIEYRLFAHYAENPEVIKAYQQDPDLSFHKMAWAMMKRYKADMLYSHQKSFNFAKQYGAKSIKLAVMMGFITEAEGDEIREARRWDDPAFPAAGAVPVDHLGDVARNHQAATARRLASAIAPEPGLGLVAPP